jgi:ethanolaminephosphotransferase
LNFLLFVAEPCNQLFQRAVSAHQEWLSSDKDSNSATIIAEKIFSQYQRALVSMREKLAASLTKYDLHAMGTGILLIWMVSCFYCCDIFS